MQIWNEITSEHIFLSLAQSDSEIFQNLNDIPVPNFLLNNIPENWIEFTPYSIQIKYPFSKFISLLGSIFTVRFKELIEIDFFIFLPFQLISLSNNNNDNNS